MATKKKLTAEQEKEIKILQANNEMLEKTKEEAKLRGNSKSVERIQLAQNDVIEQVKKIDATLAKDMVKGKQVSKSDIEVMMEAHAEENDTESIYEILENHNNELKSVFDNTASTVSNNEVYYDTTKFTQDTDFNNIDPDIQYDIISLPSNGEGYASKMSRVPVAYLTAYDENFITSPNLYKDGLVIDFLLKNKIMNKDINIDELYSGDIDAIVLFLRATSYGPEFPISANDPETGERVQDVVDLTTLKPKEFTLKGDKDGLFDFELPVSKDLIKFKFLTRKDEKTLKLLTQLEDDNTKAVLVESSVDILEKAINTDNNLTPIEKKAFNESLDKFDVWLEKLKDNKRPPINKIITNRMELTIKSINGNSDRSFIAKYVKNMGTKDSLAYRKYLIANEPGINFEIEVKRPENLGGGSFKTFLEWDDTVFLNIA